MRFHLCRLTAICSLSIFTAIAPCCAQSAATGRDSATPLTLDDTESSSAADSNNGENPLTAQSNNDVEDSTPPETSTSSNRRIPIPSKLFPFAPSMQQ